MTGELKLEQLNPQQKQELINNAQEAMNNDKYEINTSISGELAKFANLMLFTFNAEGKSKQELDEEIIRIGLNVISDRLAMKIIK
jgi:hypothetical protein